MTAEHSWKVLRALSLLPCMVSLSLEDKLIGKRQPPSSHRKSQSRNSKNRRNFSKCLKYFKGENYN